MSIETLMSAANAAGYVMAAEEQLPKLSAPSRGVRIQVAAGDGNRDLASGCTGR